jgi:molecular chaperone GrpE
VGGTGGSGRSGGSGGTAQATLTAEPDRAEQEALQAELDERTADLKRITAEYANYRKRVDRDREAVVTIAKASVVADLLGVLDDLERAEAHGDLTGAFRAVGDKLTTSLQKAGLNAFAHEGEPFDPMLHEAVQHATSPDVSSPTVTAVLRRGYKFGERVLRPAMVAVTDHEPGEPPTVDDSVADSLIEPEPPGALARSDSSEGSGDSSGDSSDSSGSDGGGGDNTGDGDTNGDTNDDIASTH